MADSAANAQGDASKSKLLAPASPPKGDALDLALGLDEAAKERHHSGASGSGSVAPLPSFSGGGAPLPDAIGHGTPNRSASMPTGHGAEPEPEIGSSPEAPTTTGKYKKHAATTGDFPSASEGKLFDDAIAAIEDVRYSFCNI